MEIPDTEGIPTAVQGMEEAVPAVQEARKRGLSVVLGTGHLVGLAVSEALIPSVVSEASAVPMARVGVVRTRMRRTATFGQRPIISIPAITGRP